MSGNPGINNLPPITGKALKDDGTTVNLADKIEAIYNALVVDKNAGMQLTGRIITTRRNTFQAVGAHPNAVGQQIFIDYY